MADLLIAEGQFNRRRQRTRLRAHRMSCNRQKSRQRGGAKPFPHDPSPSCRARATPPAFAPTFASSLQVSCRDGNGRRPARDLPRARLASCHRGANRRLQTPVETIEACVGADARPNSETDMRSSSKLALPLAAFIVAVAALATPLRAADWPTRPVTVIVPFAAGGNTDMMARLGPQHLSAKLGQTVVIANPPGARRAARTRPGPAA